MTKEEIIRLAQQAGYKDTTTIRAAYYGFNLEHFVELVLEAEREACCAVVYGQCDSDNVAQRTVAAIRARQ